MYIMQQITRLEKSLKSNLFFGIGLNCGFVHWASDLEKLLSGQRNQLAPDNQTEFFLSPIIQLIWYSNNYLEPNLG